MSLLFVGCASTERLTYFNDLDYAVVQAEAIDYQTKIKCDDELSILVSCSDMAVAQPYNLNVASPYKGTSSSGLLPDVTTQTSDAVYRVDSHGEINFPILGKIYVEGLTRAELVESLTREIGKDIKDPVVTVTVTNFNITIIGDINSPGNYTFNTEKVNVIQAIAEAGDLSSTARFDDIVLIRKVNGKQTYEQLDFTSKEILESEQFYLQQNDILYVKPDSAKVTKKNDPLRVWTVTLSSITSLLAIASFFL